MPRWFPRAAACLLAFVLSAHAETGRASDFVLLSSTEAATLKAAMQRGDPTLAPVVQRLRRAADKALHDGPWSITSISSKAKSGDPHDYYSEGPYWWPDPKNPKAPYIRRDGEVNPDRFDKHGKAMGQMSDAVLVLGMAAYLLDDATAGRRAADVIHVWFLDPKTRMNPHLNYAQAIFGRTEGRGIGIIDSHVLIRAVVGVAFLSHTPFWNAADQAAAQQWFRDYLHWLTTSKNGLDEKNERNNHGSWWTAQVVALADFVGDASTARMGFDWYRTRLVPIQMRPDGSCPFEEARTRSLSYSVFNLDALATLCRMAQLHGVDLWHYETSDGSGMRASVAYLAPYVLHPETWKKKQITPYERRRVAFLHWAAAGLHDEHYRDVYRQLPQGGGAEDILRDLLDAGTPR